MSQFHEELMVTGVVLTIAVIGSFYILSQLTAGEPESEQQVVQIRTVSETMEPSPEGEVAGEQTSTPAEPSTTPEPTEEGTASAEAEVISVPFGEDGSFENEYYRLELTHPRIEVDQAGGARKFKIDAVLYNKTVSEGLANTLESSIIRDGRVIVERAAMSLTESKLVKPKQKLTYTASVSLIEGTDAQTVYFEPTEADLPEAVHVLRP